MYMSCIIALLLFLKTDGKLNTGNPSIGNNKQFFIFVKYQYILKRLAHPNKCSSNPLFAYLFRFVLAAVSPAVVVPSLLNLSDRGYGLDKGIPTLVIAAASVDDVLAITGFGVVLGIAFTQG